ncbi:MAG: VOC family protein [Candidatus Moranbacteria bacterium]|nr:VOC family protein [Candidatus Moranbacteria bacterium]
MKNMNNKMSPVVHFEMPYEDRMRMVDFYSKTFGWKAQLFGEEMGNYALMVTADLDENNMPKKPGTINGGFYEKTKDHLADYPSVVIAVEDIEESMKNIKEGGGKVLSEPMDIPGYGLYASFIDTEGNRVGMMQPYMKM